MLQKIRFFDKKDPKLSLSELLSWMTIFKSIHMAFYVNTSWACALVVCILFGRICSLTTFLLFWPDYRGFVFSLTFSLSFCWTMVVYCLILFVWMVCFHPCSVVNCLWILSIVPLYWLASLFFLSRQPDVLDLLFLANLLSSIIRLIFLKFEDTQYLYFLFNACRLAKIL